MNITIIVALITAISAISAPIITTFIENRYQLKIKKIELHDEKRIKVINDYIAYLGEYVHVRTVDNASEMSKSMYSIFLYAPESMWEDIKKLNKCIEERQFSEAIKLLPGVAQQLSPCISKGKSHSK